MMRFIAPNESHKEYLVNQSNVETTCSPMEKPRTSHMIGVQTALNDNPKLNTRLWKGNNPIAVSLTLNKDYPNVWKFKFKK